MIMCLVRSGNCILSYSLSFISSSFCKEGSLLGLNLSQRESFRLERLRVVDRTAYILIYIMLKKSKVYLKIRLLRFIGAVVVERNVKSYEIKEKWTT